MKDRGLKSPRAWGGGSLARRSAYYMSAIHRHWDSWWLPCEALPGSPGSTSSGLTAQMAFTPALFGGAPGYWPQA